VVDGGQAPVSVKTEDGAEAMKIDEAPVVKAEAPAVKAEPGSASPAAQPRSSAKENAQQLPTTPASQLKSNGSMMASPSPFV